jgi:hypothetical protein
MDRIVTSLQQPHRWHRGLVIIVAFLIACSAKKSDEVSRSLLVGRFQLQIRSACSSKGLMSDELVLHADGRLEQHTHMNNGNKYDAADQHWSYVPDHSVSLNDWLDLTDNPSGKAGAAVLLIELNEPPVILVNPDSDCVYVKQ